MRSNVTLEIKGVVEALAAEGAVVPLGGAVALHVPIQEALQGKHLVADFAEEGVVAEGDPTRQVVAVPRPSGGALQGSKMAPGKLALVRRCRSWRAGQGRLPDLGLRWLWLGHCTAGHRSCVGGCRSWFGGRNG